MIKKLNFRLILFVFIIGLAFFLRLYKIDRNFVFVYDQGRDAQVIQKILKGKFTLIGSTTGIPGFFLGPFYYYFITPLYLIGLGNPVAPLVFLIFIDILGILILSLIVKQKNNWFAFFSCFLLLAVNFSHIKHSRWLSNPNPIFIIAPLYFFFLLKLLKLKKSDKQINMWFFLGLLLGLLLQTELANAIFIIPITLVIIIFRKRLFNFKGVLYYLLAFFCTQLPIIFFNFRHQFIMVTALKNYFNQQSEKIPLKDILINRPKAYLDILSFFIWNNKNIFILLIIFLACYLLIKKFWKDDLLLVVTSWFFIPLVLMLFYTSNKGIIWDYYLITQPLPLLMILSLALSDLIKKAKLIGLLFTLLVISVFANFNFKEWRVLVSGDLAKISFGTMKDTIDYVYKEANGKSFNVEVFVPNFLPNAYEYLFSWYGKNRYGYFPSATDQRQRLVFFIMEPGQKYHNGEQYWRNWWYDQRKNTGKLIKTYKIGDIDIETRERLSL